jgi:hypothetical protein
MRRLLAVVQVVAFAAIPAVAVAQHGAERPAQLAPCQGSIVWVDYADVEGGVPLGCDLDPPQELWVDHIPGTLTFGQAHTWCTNHGGPRIYSRWLQHANVCEDIDY